MKITELHKDINNARKHNERNIAMIKDSLTEVGAARSIVIDEDNNILAGNGTVEAAGQMGIEKVKIIDAAGDEIIAVRRTGLTDEQKKKLALYDNRTVELAEWDPEILIKLNEELNIEQLWNDNELAELLKGDFTIELPNESAETTDEVISDREPIVKLGDIFTLGSHRLMCGDSSDSDSVAKLMNGKKARLFATDPPYGVNYVKTKSGIPKSGYATLGDDYEDIESDNFQDEQLQQFLESVFGSWLPFLENAAWYLWHAHLTQGFFAAAAAAAAADVLLHRQIIWVKPGFNLTRSGMYHWAHEPCFYGWQKGKQPAWYGEKNQRTVWEIDRASEKYNHPTQKPLEVFSIPMQNHLKPREVCAEPFAGSGSQVIAAEANNVCCYAMEISPIYVEGIIRRYFSTYPEQKSLFNHENGHITLDEIIV